MKTLSVVCARAGSKGLKNKCIAAINGKMLVEYAIEYSLSLGETVKTAVSTDIDEVISYCNKRDIVCIKRNQEFCQDDSRIDDVLADALQRQSEEFEYCSLIYGNIPTRYVELFNTALYFLQKNQSYDAAMSMQNVEKFHPAWMFDFNEEIVPKEVELHYRRQALPQKMIHDGHTVLFRSKEFLNRYKGLVGYDSEYRYAIFGSKIKPLINDKLIIDIDTEKDMKWAEAIMRQCK